MHIQACYWDWNILVCVLSYCPFKREKSLLIHGFNLERRDICSNTLKLIKRCTCKLRLLASIQPEHGGLRVTGLTRYSIACFKEDILCSRSGSSILFKRFTCSNFHEAHCFPHTVFLLQLLLSASVSSRLASLESLVCCDWSAGPLCCDRSCVKGRCTQKRDIVTP